ncbi:hypothetical protein [Clostridium sp.]|uniref:hypothetical protein n=1 Tax=Clostridium sp. TaxID=1506 RepID=UPI003F403B90
MKKLKRTIFITLALVLTMVVAVWAFRSSNDSIKNDFIVADLNVSIDEDFKLPTDFLYPGDSHIKDVKVKNNSNQPIFVRVMALPQIALGEMVLETKAIVLLDIDEANWRDGKDGYYYYKGVLEVGKTTASLFKNVSIADNISKDIYENSKFDIMVKSEGCPITRSKVHINSWWGGNAPTEEPLKSISDELSKIAERDGAR